MFMSSDHYLYTNNNNNSVFMDCPQITIKPLATRWNYTNKIEVAPNCPRCASSNTKFCYYNNYSLSQPRYFCKACRRYWTKGGSLRNVPVGGGCRKTRRSRSSRSSSDPTRPPPHSPDVTGSDGGACIDLAAVFASYVNQSGVEESSFSPGGSSGSSSENVPASSLEMDSQIEDQMGVYEFGNGQVQQLLPDHFSLHHHQMMDGQDFVYQQEDCSAFHGISLGDELLWSDASDLPSFGSNQHPTAQDQDFGLFSPDDQFRISGTDNWASFDLSTYEIFSTP